MQRTMQDSPDSGEDAGWRLAIGRSRILVGVVAAGHLLAAAAVLSAPLPAVVRLASLGALAFSAVSKVRQVALLAAAGSIVSLTVSSAGAVRAVRRDGGDLSGQVLTSTFVSPLLTIVRLRVSGGSLHRSVLLVADNCEAQAFRRLRVGLRWRVAPSLLQFSRAD
jgi:toxin CptA